MPNVFRIEQTMVYIGGFSTCETSGSYILRIGKGDFDVCKGCRKFKMCFERREICTAYEPIDYDRIRKTLQTEMQSAKASGAESTKSESTENRRVVS